MSIEQLTAFMGWNLLINVCILVLSTLLLLAFRKSISNIHSSLFGLEEKDLGRAYFQYLAQYKIAIIVFNLAPYFALRIIG